MNNNIDIIEKSFYNNLTKQFFSFTKLNLYLLNKNKHLYKLLFFNILI